MEKGEKAKQEVWVEEDGERKKGKFTSSLTPLPYGHILYPIIFMVK